MSTPRQKPTCAETSAWIRARLGRSCFAPLTGTTSRVFSAYLHALQAWFSCPTPQVEAALRALVAVLQRSEWHLAAWAIPAIGDWGHVAELWPKIKPPGAPDFVGVADEIQPGTEFWGVVMARGASALRSVP